MCVNLWRVVALSQAADREVSGGFEQGVGGWGEDTWRKERLGIGESATADLVRRHQIEIISNTGRMTMQHCSRSSIKCVPEHERKNCTSPGPISRALWTLGPVNPTRRDQLNGILFTSTEPSSHNSSLRIG